MNYAVIYDLVAGILLFATWMYVSDWTTPIISKAFGGNGQHAKCTVCTKVAFNGYLTNWTVSHFVLYLILSYLRPQYSTFFILLGILWEIIELLLEYMSQFDHKNVMCKLLTKCKKTFRNKTQFWQHYFGIRDSGLDVYWCSGGLVGSMMDIVANTLGVIAGSTLATHSAVADTLGVYFGSTLAKHWAEFKRIIRV
jgi:hypothetical protein